MIAFLFMVQEVISVAPPTFGPVSGPVLPVVAVPRLGLPKRCAAEASASDVTVCGSRSAEERYRLTPLSDRYVEPPVRAAVRLSESTTAALVVHQQDYGSGFVSKRISLDFSLLFGGNNKRAR